MDKTLKDTTITDVIYVHQTYPVKEGGVVTLPDGAVVDENLFGTATNPPAGGGDSKAGTAKAGTAQAK